MIELALAISLAGEPMEIEQELVSSPVSNAHRITHMIGALRNPNRMAIEIPPTQEEVRDLMSELIEQDIRDTTPEPTQTAPTRPRSTDY